jgi:trans-aconitate 2-methyltransferase
MRWDPAEYLRFGEERGRAFRDLLARVPAGTPQAVVDLGCGPGNLTRELSERWPDADVEGVDSSAEMIERARADGQTDRLRFSRADLRGWEPSRPVDVVTCNATLQWVPDHLGLLPRLLSAVRPGGFLAFQVPGNFAEPTHTSIAELCASPKWRADLAGTQLATPRSEEPGTYLEALLGLGCAADVWETTYLQVLPGEDAVVRWMTGTGLRPVLGALDPGAHEEFLHDYRSLVAAHYPRRDAGTVLPYRRIFAVAQRTETSA